MNPSHKGQVNSRSSLARWFSHRRALLTFVVCLGIGLAFIALRAKGRFEAARSIARSEARAAASSIELQLNQAASTAETLGILAKQGRLGLTNFQKIATELLTAHPALTTLELQPGGVVSDVVPRVGHERAIGFNVLKDPGQRAGANETISRRVLTLVGPVSLHTGQPGIIARVPVFQRTPDGRESFWGFVAVSMGFKELLAHANVDELWRHGYQYCLYASSSGPQKVMMISSHGLLTIPDAVQQSVRVQNLEQGLALKPRSGWVDKTELAVESAAVVLIAALVSVLVNMLGSGPALEAALEALTQRHAREAQERERAQADCQAAKDRMTGLQAELKAAQLAVVQAESKTEQVQSKLDGSEKAQDKAAQAHHAELKEAHEALKSALETNAQLKSQLDTAAQAEKKAAEITRERHKQDQSAMSELKARVEAAERSARDATRANAIKVEQLEQTNRDLKAQLTAAERLQARIAQLEGLLQTAEEELKHRQEESTKALESPPAEPDEAVSLSATELEKESPAPQKVKAPRTRKTRSDDQLRLFGTEESAVAAPSQPTSPVEPETSEAPEPRTSTKAMSPAPPVDPSQLRKACNQIFPLLSERDPGAKDCLKDNRKTFRSAFTPEAYVEFEKLIGTGDFEPALEELKKAARRHGVSF